MDSKPKIILVDDHLLFRQGLKSILTIENIAEVIGEASNGIEFIDLLSQLNPDLVMMDIDMPQMNGIEATKKAMEIFPDIKIIIYTMFGDKEYAQKMKSLGIKAFMLKSSGINELEKVICDVMNSSSTHIEPDNKIRPPTPIENDINSERSTISENNQSH